MRPRRIEPSRLYRPTPVIQTGLAMFVVGLVLAMAAVAAAALFAARFGPAITRLFLQH